MTEFSIGEDALLAYADGRLEGEQKLAVERFLAANPDKAAEISHWQRQNEALTALFAGTAKEPVPSRLKPHHIAHELKREQSWRRQFAVAAALLVVLGGATGWFGRDLLMPAEAQSDLLIDNAVVAHNLFVKEKRHAVEVAAAEQDHLVSWLSNRIERQIDAPDLVPEGFTLVGGRLLPAGAYSETGPAAQLMYENASAERLTLYITGPLPDKKEAWEYTSRGGVEAYYWADATVTCTIVGDMPETQLRMLGKKVFEQLTWRPDSTWKQS
ncbi:MAG: anti-sigma factor [Devosia sp.]